jgi:hypothetical protein
MACQHDYLFAKGDGFCAKLMALQIVSQMTRVNTVTR